MSKEPNNIDGLIREKLDGFEMTPPPGVWENTAAAMQAGRKKRFFLWFAFGIAALAILGTSVYFFSSEKTTNDQLATANTLGQASKSTEKNSTEGQNTDLNSKKSETVKNDLDSEIEQNENGSNGINSDGTTSGDETNSGTNSSGTNMNAGRQNSAANNPNNNQRASNNQSQGNSSSSQQASSAQGLNQSGTGENGSGGDSVGENNPSGRNNLNSPASSQKANDEVIAQANNDTKQTVQYSALPTYDIALFKTGELNKRPPIELEEGSIIYEAPKRKALSLEGSIGASIFNNKAFKDSTDTLLLSILNNASSNRRSFDFRFGLNYHFTNRVSFQTGIHYNSSSEDYSYTNTETTTYSYNDTISFSVDTFTMDTTFVINPVFYDSTVVITKSERNTYKIFSLPFQIGWSQPISKRAALEFALGGELSIFGKNSGSTILDVNNAISSSEAYHTTGMLSIGGSIKYLYHFRERHAVYVEPWVQFGVTNQFTPQLNYTSLRRRGGIRFGYRIFL